MTHLHASTADLLLLSGLITGVQAECKWDVGGLSDYSEAPNIQNIALYFSILSMFLC